MSESFFVDRLESHGLSVLVPDTSHHDFLNDAIYEELVHGVVLPRTRSRVVSIIEELWDAGAGGVLLGCTELELLVKQADVELPVFPCTTAARPGRARRRAGLSGRTRGAPLADREGARSAVQAGDREVGRARLGRQVDGEHLRTCTLAC